jgi:FMN reductase [NAD(P)H]
MERSTNTGREVMQEMQKRVSCRLFEDRPIEDGLLHEILKTGINAASGGNLQPYSIIVVKDQERKDQLCKMSWGQPFISSAAVDLVFCIDWHKYLTYAGMTDAPFAANEIFSEFIVAIEDMAIAAQTIETAAFFSGIGACFVASIIDAGKPARELLNLPKYVYPIAILSLGYPKNEEQAKRKHMAYEGMVFEEKYPDFTEDDIRRLFEDKFDGLRYNLPTKEPNRTRKLAQLEAALKECYSEEETARILNDVVERGYMNEPQRCFGLFYNVENMKKLSAILLKEMEECGIVMK